MSVRELVAEIEALDDTALYDVIAGLCPKHLDTVHAFAGFECHHRDLHDAMHPFRVPDAQLPLLAEVA